MYSVTVRAADTELHDLLSGIEDPVAAAVSRAERAMLAALDGSCRTPLAGHARLENGTLRFRGHALTLDGVHCFETTRDGATEDAERMGREAGEQVKRDGGSLIAF